MLPHHHDELQCELLLQDRFSLYSGAALGAAGRVLLQPVPEWLFQFDRKYWADSLRRARRGVLSAAAVGTV